MNKIKKLTIVAIAAFIAVALIALALSQSSPFKTGQNTQAQTSNIEKTEIATDNSGKVENHTDSDINNKEDEKKSNQMGNSTKNSGDLISKSEIYISPPIYNDSASAEQDVEAKVPEREVIQFPYRIPGSDLSIESIRSYDGLFIENGSDSPVNGIATLLIKNNGSSDYDLANIKLIGDGIEYSFQATGIGSGKDIAVQEANAQPATSGPFYSVDSETSQETTFTSDPDLSYTLNDEGVISITNNSDKAKPVVRIYYKFYLPEYSAYIGGITYTAKVDGLAAGETKTISPSHFDSESSEIIRIQSYSE